MAEPFTFRCCWSGNCRRTGHGQRGFVRAAAIGFFSALIGVGIFFWLKPEKSAVDSTWEVVRRTEIMQSAPPQQKKTGTFFSANFVTTHLRAPEELDDKPGHFKY